MYKAFKASVLVFALYGLSGCGDSDESGASTDHEKSPAISPMADLESGVPGFIIDTQTGCAVWLPIPEPGEKVSWNGICREGFAEGQGQLRTKTDRYIGGMLRGKMDGWGTATNAKGESYIGEWRDSLPNGAGTYTFANGDRLAGRFRNGRFIDPGQ